jgi:hypothetical protein
MAMKRWALAAAVAWFNAGSLCAEPPSIDRNIGKLAMPASRAADLAKIDRTIRKEPTYHSKPQYFLLTFGPEAKKRIWVVLDGDDCYVDRNSNGDLTEVGERGKVLDDVAIEGDGKIPITLHINPPGQDGYLICEACVQGRYIQYAAVKPADRPQDAPVYQFQGPLRIELDGPKKLLLGQPNRVFVSIGTPSRGGDENAGWVVISQDESIPPSISPRMEIEFSGKEKGGPPTKITVALRRTGQALFIGTVMVPSDVGDGKAKVRLSFPEWKGFDVAPTVQEVPVTEPGPEDKETVQWLQRQQQQLDKATGMDLARVDRRIPPQPVYKSKPQYFLLVLGREGKARTWLVLDGNTLYVDRNGRGGWVKADKEVDGRTIAFTVREIQELDGAKHTNLKVNVTASRIHSGRYRFRDMSLEINGRYGEYTFIGGTGDSDRSGESAQEAPARQFGGPLRLELRSRSLASGDKPAELDVVIGTQNPGGEWVFLYNDHGIPKDIHPVANIEFPNREPGMPPIKLKVALTQRC